jgi:hypothetical protein
MQDIRSRQDDNSACFQRAMKPVGLDVIAHDTTPLPHPVHPGRWASGSRSGDAEGAEKKSDRTTKDTRGHSFIQALLVSLVFLVFLVFLVLGI